MIKIYTLLAFLLVLGGFCPAVLADGPLQVGQKAPVSQAGSTTVVLCVGNRMTLGFDDMLVSQLEAVKRAYAPAGIEFQILTDSNLQPALDYMTSKHATVTIPVLQVDDLPSDLYSAMPLMYVANASGIVTFVQSGFTRDQTFQVSWFFNTLSGCLFSLLPAAKQNLVVLPSQYDMEMLDTATNEYYADTFQGTTGRYFNQRQPDLRIARPLALAPHGYPTVTVCVSSIMSLWYVDCALYETQMSQNEDGPAGVHFQIVSDFDLTKVLAYLSANGHPVTVPVIVVKSLWTSLGASTVPDVLGSNRSGILIAAQLGWGSILGMPWILDAADMMTVRMISPDQRNAIVPLGSGGYIAMTHVLNSFAHDPTQMVTAAQAAAATVAK